MPESLETLVPRSLQTLASETLFRAPAQSGFLLNPGDPGLVETVRAISAEQASKTPGPGRKPIVAHANHVLYGLSLLNRAIAGDPSGYVNADWSLAWKLESASDDEWQRLIADLDREATAFHKSAGETREWSEIMLTGCFGAVAHVAYHLGAVRQILRVNCVRQRTGLAAPLASQVVSPRSNGFGVYSGGTSVRSVSGQQYSSSCAPAWRCPTTRR
jgi:hypothetical protein